MDFSNASFGTFDYIIFAFMLAFSAIIGIYYRFSGGQQQTNNEYFLADKKMPILPVAFSLMASFMSAITLLGVASENYMYGTQFVAINIAYILGTPIAAYIFLPVFFQLRVTSAFEYLESRFSKSTRLIASAIFIMQMALYMSIVLYAPALTLSAVTGISRWIAVIAIGVVCTFYCTIGGIKAVLWTDLFQSLLMFSAVIAVIAKGTLDVGGFYKVWDIASDGDRLHLFNVNPDPTVRHTFWTLAIGGIFTYVSIYGINQAQIQRLMTVQNLKKSQMALFMNWIITSMLSILTSFAGLVVYANMYNCDPLLRSDVTNVKQPDQILPYYVMVSLSSLPGLPGLFVAGVFSGALSTMSSAINSLAAVTVEDFFRPFFFHKTLEKRITAYTKLTALVYGLLCIVLTYVVEKLGGVLQASLTIFNVVGGPMLGLFSLGMLCRRANTKGSLCGFFISLILCFWIGFGSMSRSGHIPSSHRSTDGCFLNTTVIRNITEPSFMGFSVDATNATLISDNITDTLEVFPLYRLSYMWYAGIGWMTCFLVGFLASLCIGEEREIYPDLLSPLVKNWKSSKNPVSEAVHMAECT